MYICIALCTCVCVFVCVRTCIWKKKYAVEGKQSIRMSFWFEHMISFQHIYNISIVYINIVFMAGK